MNFYKKVAFMFLYSIIGVLVFMIVSWGVIIVHSNNIVQDRLSDLVVIASEENCLSADGEAGSTALSQYNKLLKASETPWLTFKTVSEKQASTNMERSYYVGSPTGSGKEYYSYIDAPQKGEAIKVELTGYISLPVLYNPTGTGMKSVEIEITKTYTTMGLRFFKDK